MAYDAPLQPPDAEVDHAPEAAAARGMLAQARRVVARQLHVLGKLADVGFARARQMLDDWNSPKEPPPKTAKEATERLNLLAYRSGRVKRAVRMAVYLRQRLIRDFRKLSKGSLVDAHRVLNDRPLGELSEQVTQYLKLNCVYSALKQALKRAPAAPRAEPGAIAEPAPEPEQEEAPPGTREVIETLHFPLHRPEPRERRPVDPLKAYVNAQPVSLVLDEIADELDFAPGAVSDMEQDWEARFGVEEAPDADPEPSPNPPPSSSPSWPGPMNSDEGENAERVSDPPWIARERGAYGSSPQGPG